MPGPIHPDLLRRARATRWYLVAGAAVGVATALLVIIQAWLLSHQIAGVFDTGSFEPVRRWFGWLLLVVAGRAGLAWFNTWLSQRSAAAVKSQLRTEILSARVAQPATTPTSTSTLVTLLTQGLDNLDGYFSKYLPQLMLAVTVPAIVAIAIFTMDFLSTFIIAITLPLIPLFMALIGWFTQQRTARRWQIQTRLAHHFADLVEGLPTLQVFGRAKAQAEGLRRSEERHRTETMGTLRVSFLSALALELLATLSVALVAVTIGLRVVNAQLDLTTALFILILAPEAYLPVRQVGVHFHDSANGVAAAEEAFAQLRAAEAAAVQRSGATDVGPLESVRIRDLSVTWPGSEHPAVSGLDLDWRRGEIVALAGASGGGKSTTLAVLMGFIGHQGGSVEVNGQPLESLDMTSWRRRVAWVGQHPGMITGTIADNITLGTEAEQADLRSLLDAAGGAGLGLEREVAEDGEGLSAGERRRVAMARALLRLQHGGELLILDEPTAGLDADTEAAVLATVRASGVGAIVVTHRPAVLAAADRVVELAGDPA